MKADRITSMETNGPAPVEAGVLYDGQVMHQRLKPFGHRFAYQVFSILVDIDQLEPLDRLSRLLSVNRPGVFSVRESDHVEIDGETLRQFSDRLLQHAGLRQPAARILLLTYPRMLGYVFNPISVFFAYNAGGDLISMIYAVRNTFGERHSYVAPVLPGELNSAGIRQTRAKLFHVSPFICMEAQYNFRVLPPGKTVRLRIHETQGDEPVLAATFNGDAVPLTTWTLARCLVRFPFMTINVVVRIHWQALRLWLKGAKFHRSPPPPPSASYGDETVADRKAPPGRA